MPITSLLLDPAPGISNVDGSVIRTDMYNKIVDLINGVSLENYNLVQKITNISTNYTVLLTDFSILANAISASLTATLPDATLSGIKNKIYTIKKIDSSNVFVVSIQPFGTQKIDGQTSLNLTEQNESIIIQSDGTNWQIISHTLGIKKSTVILSPSITNALTINYPTGPTGSATAFISGISNPNSTITFSTTNQTGDYISHSIGIATLINPIATGTITNGATLKILGAPVGSTNVTITNAYALWVAAGTTKLDGPISTTGLLTSTGGITMSGSDITLAGNKIKIINHNIFEGTVAGQNSVLIQPFTINIGYGLSLVPSGTSNTGHFTILRTSDVATNYEYLRLSSDLIATNQFELQIQKAGTGVLRSLNIYMGATKLLSFDTANTITSYVTHNFQATPVISYAGIVEALTLYRPDNNIGVAFPVGFRIYKNNSSGVQKLVTGIFGFLNTATAGAEDGGGELTIMKSGAEAIALTWNTTAFIFQSGWDVVFNGKIITAAAQESTGVGSALLGSNSPAVTLTAPYKWIKFQTSDGSIVYIPAWK